ncbi:MAG: hypothetical protein JXB15_07190 [Anaerolineales bacterium]|nr:hypothetical protein [Anaerolineales bacterium]
MIPPYIVLAERIRSELSDIEPLIERAERAVAAIQRNPENQDFFVDSAALNLHDFYSGLERIFQQIATNIDQHLPDSRDWHRELLEQMHLAISTLRPAVISESTLSSLDEFMRFRHVVRNVYTFTLDVKQIHRLVEMARPAFQSAQADLLNFALFLDEVGK